MTTSVDRRLIARGLDRLARVRRGFLDRRAIDVVLDDLARAGLSEPGWVVTGIHAPRWSPNGVTVVLIGSRPNEPLVAVKLSHVAAGAASLVRERNAELALHADSRLATWHHLVPLPLLEGEAAGLRYTAETAAPGAAAITTLAGPEPQPAGIRAAMFTILELHLRTRVLRYVDDELLAHWIDEPVRVLSGLAGGGANGPRTAALGALRALLRGRLAGRQLGVSRVHGDYWAGNILLGPDATTPLAIVDWDRSAADELPWHDVLHLLVFRPRSGIGNSLASAIRALQADDLWAPWETSLLGETRAQLPDDTPDDHVLALAYWLRHTAGTLTLYPGLRRDRGFAASVDEVLAAADLG